jgi:predicted nucleic acid-binding protein
MSFMTAFDTNVLIYACDSSDSTRQDKALALIASTADGVILWQVACEFIAASRKLAPQGFGPEAAWERLTEFLSLFPLVAPSSQALVNARDLHLRQGWSFWDAMIVAACMECRVTRLYSEDLPGRSAHGIKIVNPFA